MAGDDMRRLRRIAGASLGCLAGVQLLHGLISAPLIAVAFGLDPALSGWLRLGRAGVAGVAFSLFGVVLGVVAAIAAVGTLSGRSWGWFLGVGAAVIWLPTACAPVSILVLAVLLHPQVRGAILSGE